MNLIIWQTNKFKRDLKRIVNQGMNLDELESIIQKLALPSRLESRYKDHALKGNWIGHRECHIKPDWLLIYYVKDNILFLVRTGSHSDLF